MNTLLRLLTLCLLCTETLIAQNPTPAPVQQKPIILLGGTAHLGNGTVIENAAISFENGKITAVGDAATAQIDRIKADVIDITGKQVYPGFIAPWTSLGLVEIDAARATQDYAEVGTLNPNTRSLIAYNTDSKVTPTVRSNGIMLAQIVPEGGLISGTSSIVQLDAWNWEDAAYLTDEGIHLNWPSLVHTPQAKESEDKQKQRIEKDLSAVEQLFREAKAFSQNGKPEVQNLKLNAMRGLFDRSKKLYIHTNDAKDIIAAVEFAKKFGITPIIIGGSDSYMITDFLRQNNVPVILPVLHRLPSRQYEDVAQQYKTPFQLQKAGVLFCLSEGGNWQQRNLPFQAGTAAAYGLTKEQALAAITSNTAKILGIDKQTGTLEVGKDATLIVSTGDALDMRTNNIEQAFIQGRKIDLNNKQKMLNKQFREKYGLK